MMCLHNLLKVADMGISLLLVIGQEAILERGVWKSFWHGGVII
jgi:hypothetical protein